MRKFFAVILTLIFTFHFSKAQLFVDPAYSVQQMMEDFFDSTGATISNVTYIGSNDQVGFFDAGSTNLGINAGIMLTSGSIYNAVGPNLSSGISTAVASSGDDDLTQLCGVQTYDASVIEFDIVPPTDTLYFEYVFGSDEYSEWVNSQFNDVFAFFLNGPGYSDSNIAVIPNTSIPVSINNVNCIDTSSFYVCNDPYNVLCGGSYGCPADPYSTTIEYDGFTTALPIYAIVQQGETYHVKIAVADAGDQVLDSGVFLSIKSLGGDDSLVCNAGANKDFNGNQVAFTDESKYASKWEWNFGDGTISNERNPVHLYDNLINNGYVVKQKVSNFCCSDSVVFGVGNFLAVQTLLNNPISVGPNPVISTLNINLKNGSSGEMYLYDVAGKVILSQQLSGDVKLDVSSLAVGAYVLAYVDGKQVYHQKILKQ